MDFSFGFKNYKCFGEQINWIEWKPITVLIGKNNSGKSSIIEIIQQLVENKNYTRLIAEKHHKNSNGNVAEPEFFISRKFDKPTLSQAFPPSVSGGDIGMNHGKYADTYVGSEYKYKLISNEKGNLLEIQKQESQAQPFMPDLRTWNSYKLAMERSLLSPLRHKKFHWIIPERQIISEEKTEPPIIYGTGNGLTNAIEIFLNHRNYDEKTVSKYILSGLNAIFNPDYHFTRITTKHESNKYEIFLEENGKLISLSNFGTGIKTVLLVLSILNLTPILECSNPNDYVYVFEELENNLHPQLLRRVLNYIYTKANELSFSVILTTHSNVTIDFFSTKEVSQILHVQNKEGAYCVNKVQTFFDSKNVLIDLDIKPSDLLQANGIIWVEGPSDRILLNKWISEWGKDYNFNEGTHYQIVFYGGRLLSHLSAEDSEENDDLIKMLRINSNAAILIDSDKKIESDTLNSTKQRIIDEFNSFQGFTWITKGKEIENYYPKEVVLRKLCLNDIQDYHNFEPFFAKLNTAQDKLGDKLSRQKTKLATSLIENFDIDTWRNVMDLDKRMTNLISEIKKWNNL
ncbi:MAG: ATP-binding protein [Bdellovibrionaceae bacterium]|nr:ATP-binding protein [Pseudobdellovibrionaceae bacterium]